MDKWIEFYTPYFQTEDEAKLFIESLEALGRTDPMHPAKIMMHQVQRLVTLADDIDKIRPGRAPMRVFFLMVCAENIAKMHAKYDEEGKSKFHAVKFFDDFCSGDDKNTLSKSIVKDKALLDWKDVVMLLYAVRNAVVHEGNYWSFDFAFQDGAAITGTEEIIEVRIHYDAFRDIVVRAGIQAVNTYTP